MPTGSTTKKTAAKKAATATATTQVPKKVAGSNGASRSPELATILADPIQRTEAANAIDLRDMMDTLIARRKNLGLGQGELAKMIGISGAVVSQAELGNTALSVNTLQRYARAVGARLALQITH